MLSPEHVRVRRQGGELKLLALTGSLRERAVALARDLVAIAGEHVGKSRAELEAAWEALEVAPRERKLFAGLAKLVEDASDFEGGDSEQAAAIRREIFALAAARRKSDDEFDREAVLAEVAARRSTSTEALAGEMYADLKGAQRLMACRAPAPEALVTAYESAQVQAILIRAVRVVAEVRCQGGDAYRALFRQLKFRRLMQRVSPLEGGGYRLEIDGPFSLFQSVAKYGLELALMLPALEACQQLRLKAEIRWSQGARPLVFEYEPAPRALPPAAPSVRDEVSETLEALTAIADGWEVELAERVLDLPGLGVCVPDLSLKRRADGATVLVEVLGFWSRESVWRRVELAERGLGERVLFVVSSRLRVSEEALDEGADAALYVYKGRINPRTLLRQVEALAARPLRASPGRA